jgi:hypothetical protein
MTESFESDPLESITCRNCGTIIRDNYCSHCGQSAKIHRLDMKHLLHNFFHAVTHMDAGYLHTIKDLAIRPGHSIREYLQGKRSSHGDPIVMLLIVGGLCTWIYKDLHIKTLTSVDIGSLKDGMPMVSMKFFALAPLGYSVIFSLVDYLVFRYKRYNYIELLVMNIFASIEILVFFILIVPAWLICNSLGVGNYLRIAVTLLDLAYLIYVRYQFFEVSSDKKAIIRIVGSALAMLLLFAVTGWKTLLEIFG